MRRISIRKMMVAVAAIGLAFAIIANLERLNDPEGGLGSVRAQCNGNLRNLSLALLAYRERNAHFPTGTWSNMSLRPEDRLSLYTAILPDIEQDDLDLGIDKTIGWDDDPNYTLSWRRPGLLRCPAHNLGSSKRTRSTTYIGIAGTGTDAPLLPKTDPRAGIFGYDRKTTLADIKDGASNTLLIVESGRATGSWLQGGPATVRGLDPAKRPYMGPNRQFGGLHRGGAWVAMADGSVRWVADSIDPKVFEAMSTMAGGEKILDPQNGKVSVRR